MSSIAFPNIAQESQETVNSNQNALTEYARAAALRQQTAQAQQMAPLQQQQAQQQIAGGDIDLQQKQQQLADQKAMTNSMHEWDGKDPSQLPGLVLKHGGSATAVMGLQQQITARQKSLLDLSKDQLANKKDQNDQLSGQLNAALEGDDDGLHGRIMDVANTAAQNGWADQSHVQALQSMANLPADQLKKNVSLYQKSLTGEAAQISQAKETAAAAESNAKAAAENTTAGLNQIKLDLAKNSKPGDFDSQVDSIYPPNAPASGGPNRMIKTQVNAALQHGDVDGAKKYIDQALENQLQLNKELDPRVQANKIATSKAEGEARAAIQNGAPIAVVPGATGEAALANIDPSTAAAIRMIGEGKGDFATFTARSTPQYKTQLAAAVNAFNPNFDQNTFKVRGSEEKAYTSGSQGQQLTAIGTARNHMSTFKQTADALDNGNFQLANKIGNAVGMQFGSDKASNFNIARSAFAGEVGKAFAGANVAVADRQDLIDKINAASSPAQLKGYADTADELLAGKQKSLKESYDQGLKGNANFGSENVQHTPGGVAHGLTEGATGTGSNGQKYVVKNGTWVAAQ